MKRLVGIGKAPTSVLIEQWQESQNLALNVDPPWDRGELERIIAELKLPRDGWLFAPMRPKWLDASAPTNHAVHRLDDNGNRFLVQQNITEYEAHRLAQVFEAKGHKQIYEISCASGQEHFLWGGRPDLIQSRLSFLPHGVRAGAGRKLYNSFKV